MENIVVGLLLGLVTSIAAYFGFKGKIDKKLQSLRTDEDLVKKALKDLDKGLKNIKKKQKGKTPDEVEDYWNNN
jgi:hypothetical protein